MSHRQAPPGRKLLPESAAPSGLLNADMQGAVGPLGGAGAQSTDQLLRLPFPTQHPGR